MNSSTVSEIEEQGKRWRSRRKYLIERRRTLRCWIGGALALGKGSELRGARRHARPQGAFSPSVSPTTPSVARRKIE